MSDDLLDRVEQALKEATPGPWDRGARHGTYCTEITSASRAVAAVWNYADHFAPGELRPTQRLSPQGEADFTIMQRAPDWLALLVQRVRAAESERDRLKRRVDLRADLQDEGFLMYAGSERAGEILALLYKSGLGKPGAPHGNTVVGMIRELIERAEAESARLQKEVEAAKMLCDIYFTIAEEFIPAEEIRFKRDAAVARKVEELRLVGRPSEPRT